MRVNFGIDPLISTCLAFAVVSGLVALYCTATAWFHHWTTETDVTNMRVVHKTGFIKRRTLEMSLDKVESVDITQSILGRLLNYGDVTIQGEVTSRAWCAAILASSSSATAELSASAIGVPSYFFIF